MVQYVLRSAGLTFRAYSNGQAALEALISASERKGAARFCWLDVDLPGLDGHSVHDRLRAERPGTYAVVFITGHAGEGDQIRALRAGALDYVSKPVDSRTLAGKIPLWRERAGRRAGPPFTPDTANARRGRRNRQHRSQTQQQILLAVSRSSRKRVIEEKA